MNNQGLADELAKIEQEVEPSEAELANPQLDVSRYPVYIRTFHIQLSKIIQEQFKKMALLVAIPLTLFFAGNAILIWYGRTPIKPELTNQLAESNRILQSINLGLVTAINGGAKNVPAQGEARKDISVPKEITEAIVAQSKLHEQAVEGIRKSQAEINGSALALLQLFGGSAIIALLGYLGLQRLQNIDTEVQSLREFMFRHINERVLDAQNLLKASVNGTVSDQVSLKFQEQKEDFKDFAEENSKAKQEIDENLSAARNYLLDVKREAKDSILHVEERVEGLEARTASLATEYPWLQNAEERKKAGKLNQLTSVQQVHEYAIAMRAQGDDESALLALKKVKEKLLSGTPDDFHNVHTEAMRMNDYILALELAEEGLKSFPDHYELMADAARALTSTGKVNDAVTLLEKFRAEKPAEFARGWRPITFYADTVMSRELTNEAIAKLRAAFEDVTARLQSEIKPWSRYAKFEQNLGNEERAEGILKQGLSYNPYAQELNYDLGEIMMQRGNAVEAVTYFEGALKYDYQPSYQHDVNQEAIRASLAQAYEANGDLEKAQLLYGLFVENSGQSRHIANYAKNRLIAIGIQKALSGEITANQDEDES